MRRFRRMMVRAGRAVVVMCVRMVHRPNVSLG